MEQTPPERRVVAAIDIGATGIRLTIAELEGERQRILESAKQPINLGRDTFLRGRIQPETVEECVRILKGFRSLMREYGISQESQVKAIATSSLREAENRDTVLNRIYIATQVNVTLLDESEVNRLLYMAVRPALVESKSWGKSDALLVEVGGGSTQLLLFQGGQVTFSETYALGSLRLREVLEDYGPPASRTIQVLEQEVQHAVDQIHNTCPLTKAPILIAMAGVTKLAASQIIPSWETKSLGVLSFKAFTQFTQEVLPLPIDELVRRFHITYPEAETVAPGLLAYLQLGRAFSVQEVWVPQVSLRDGLLREMAFPTLWSEELGQQVLRSAQTLGERFRFDARHGLHVATLCLSLFQELQSEHLLGNHDALLLQVAAILHDIGLVISNRSHHKHSYYLLSNSDLFGLSKADMRCVALVSRYHRRGAPSMTHPEYAELDRESRMVVSKMAAILRVADALDRNHLQQVQQIRCSREGGQLVITIWGLEDLSLERFALQQKGSLFEEVYGLPVILRQGRGLRSNAP